jgi:hypothetical protein
MNWQKKYRWIRTWGSETGLNGLPHEDYSGYDGDQNIGRIYLDQQTLKAGKWRWAIQYPKGGQPWMPNTGWVDTAVEAAQNIEEVWDKQKARLSS